MSEKDDIQSIAEHVVELDRIVARMPDVVFPTEEHFVARCYDRDEVYLDDQGCVEGEPFKTNKVVLRPNGRLVVWMTPATGAPPGAAGEIAFVEADVSRLDDSFPELYRQLDAYIMRETSSTGLGDFVWDLYKRLSGKPALVDVVADYLKSGRKGLTVLQKEEAEAEQEVFYDRKDDYGMF